MISHKRHLIRCQSSGQRPSLSVGKRVLFPFCTTLLRAEAIPTFWDSLFFSTITCMEFILMPCPACFINQDITILKTWLHRLSIGVMLRMFTHQAVLHTVRQVQH